MAASHPGTELIPYLRGELAVAEADRLTGHLGGCPDCRRELDELRRTVDALRQSAPEPPAIHWGRYRAELSTKLGERGGRAPARRWWLSPVPLTLAAGLAALLAVVVVQEGIRGVEDLRAFEEAVIGRRLDLLRQYRVVERLDLLEDLDVIRQLDRLAGSREG